MKSVLLLALLVLSVVFLPSNAQPMVQPCQTNQDCPGWGPCQLGAVCTEGVCLYANVVDGTPCEPHDWCYSSGVCMWGECIELEERNCTMYDGDCSVGVCNSELERCEPDFFLFGTVCDEDVGPCEHPGVCSGHSMHCEYPGTFEDGTPCESGSFCLVGETCHYGQCQGGMGRDCSEAGDMCNQGVCNEELDQCMPMPLVAQTPCSTGLPTGLCLDAELCDGQGTCVQHFKEEGTLCRQGDGTPCNPDEQCTGESSFCPIDQIDQSDFCRGRPLNCVGDDCDDHDQEPPHHYEEEDVDHGELKGWIVAILIILIVLLVIVIMYVLGSWLQRPSPAGLPSNEGYQRLNSKIGGGISKFVSMAPLSFTDHKNE